jgi:glycerophosphoryl diester phosphodiesterase
MTKNNFLLCIGHRGAMGHSPENTLASINMALTLGAQFIEVDVYHVEGELVVFHDNRLERTTNGVGYIDEQSLAYLSTLDAGEGQRIPTLSEVCELIRGQACINIELKGAHTAAPVAKFIEHLVAQGWHYSAILVSSFNHQELLTLKQLNPQILLAVLIYGIPIDYAKFAEDLGAYAINPSIEFINQALVDDAHARNLKVYAYTANHPADIEKMQQLGVDGVFSNYPERVLAAYPQATKLELWLGKSDVSK